MLNQSFILFYCLRRCGQKLELLIRFIPRTLARIFSNDPAVLDLFEACRLPFAAFVVLASALRLAVKGFSKGVGDFRKVWKGDVGSVWFCMVLCHSILFSLRMAQTLMVTWVTRGFIMGVLGADEPFRRFTSTISTVNVVCRPSQKLRSTLRRSPWFQTSELINQVVVIRCDK